MRAELDRLYAPDPVPSQTSDQSTDDAPTDDEPGTPTDDTDVTDEVGSDDEATDESDTEPTDPEPPRDTIPDCVMTIFTTSCAGPSCHYGALFNFPPNFERDNLFELLTTEQNSCPDVDRYVDLENPEQSLLLLKLQPSPPCGAQMPSAPAAPLTDEQTACMEDWFDALAE